MAEQPLLYHQVDGIAILTLNNPERRNALFSPLLAALRDRLDEIREDSTVRVVVLRSTGPVFSSGHDMRELVGRDAESYAAHRCGHGLLCHAGGPDRLFCTTPGVAVSRAVRSKKAMEMLLTGTPISASEAAEHGLVNRVVAPEQLNEEVMALARQISSASAYTVAIGKQAFYRQRDMDLPAAYEMAQRVMVEDLLADDAQEGITAFLEKRPPKWTT